MGRISRESRLCFLLLFTIADDYGKLRGNSRMLASLLYPYDDDAARLIEEWLTQLEQQNCIIRYQIDSAHYIKIVNWEAHQKVDRPTLSKIPDPREDSCHPREESRAFSAGSEDLRIKDQRRGTRVALTELPPEWKEFCQTERPDLDPDKIFQTFHDHWIAQPGERGMKTDWFATWRNWVRRETRQPAQGASGSVDREREARQGAITL